MRLYVEIKGNVDSLLLWSLIEKYKVNLTALDTKTYVYGDVDITTATIVISRCALFGDLRIELSGPQ